MFYRIRNVFFVHFIVARNCGHRGFPCCFPAGGVGRENIFPAGRCGPPFRGAANPLSQRGFSANETGDFRARCDFFPVIPVRQGKTGGSHREVLGLRVVDDDRRGRLLRVELVFLGEGDADFLGAEQPQ